MRELSAAEIEALLAEVPVGRLGLWSDGEVYVVPVGFARTADAIWFHTAPGRKTRALAEHPDCCFEVDRYDPATAAWASVIAWGRARPDPDPAGLAALVRRFGPVLHKVLGRGGGGRLWRLDVARITGRAGP